MASSGEGGRAAVAVSGQGERGAAAVSGQGERAAVVVSSHDVRAAFAVSGDGEAAVSCKREQCDSLDYPCTARLRWRRLLAFLRENCSEQIYDVVKDRLGLFFDVEDLVKRVKAGKFKEACHYVWTFAPIRQLNSHAELLTVFLNYFAAVHRFADGDTATEGIVRDWFRRLYRNPAVLSKYPCLATVVADVLSLRTHHVRDSLDWRLARHKAAEIIMELVFKTPHLKEMTRYPRGQNDLYDVMPIRCSFRPRRQVKQIGKKQPTDLAKFYLEMKKRIVPSAEMDYQDDSAGSSRKLGVVLIELFEKVLQAGQRMVLKQGHPPEYLSRGVFTLKDAHVCKSIPGHMMIQKAHRPEHASNQEKVFRVVQPVMLNQGHRSEYLSRGVFPLEAVHAYNSRAECMVIEQGHRPEHASNHAMKRPRFLESHRDTVHQGNAIKRPCLAGNFVKF